MAGPAVMANAAVSWGLGAALAIVASGAAWRLARPAAGRAAAHQRTDSALHLLMAVGMAAMLIGCGGAVTQGLGLLFGAVAVAMLARGRLHHAVVCGIMVLMVRVSFESESSAGMDMRMSMSMPPKPPPAGQGMPLLVLAAFGYAAISACVFVWRRRPSGGEILMLVSTAVMLLPMI
jgi:hypothetical protein